MWLVPFVVLLTMLAAADRCSFNDAAYAIRNLITDGKYSSVITFLDTFRGMCIADPPEQVLLDCQASYAQWRMKDYDAASALLLKAYSPENEELFLTLLRNGSCYYAITSDEEAYAAYLLVPSLSGEFSFSIKDVLAYSSKLRETIGHLILEPGTENFSQTFLNMHLDPAPWYDGPVIPDDRIVPQAELYKQFITYIRISDKAMIDNSIQLRVIAQAKKLLTEADTIGQVSIAARESLGSLVVFGDIHGDLFNAFTQFHVDEVAADHQIYIFNGDFVDRGYYGLETVFLLYLAKAMWPHNIYLNRGNHEQLEVCTRFGFYTENMLKGSRETFMAYTDSFESIPIGMVVDGKVFVVHGGIPADAGVSLTSMQTMDRRKSQHPAITDMLWADPTVTRENGISKRGISYTWGKDRTNEFLEAEQLSLIVRSHQLAMGGWVSTHDGKVITVFSSSNYNESGNAAATLIFLRNIMESHHFWPMPIPGTWTARRTLPVHPTFFWLNVKSLAAALLGSAAERATYR